MQKKVSSGNSEVPAIYPVPRNAYPVGSHSYIYKTNQDYQYQTNWRLRHAFDSQWLSITSDGLITVKANEHGYAWDGCTPKYSIFDLFIVGVPDGIVNLTTGRPYTYYATLVHDVMYQYYEDVPVPKREIDLLFLQMMGDFKLRKLYYYPVKWWAGGCLVQRGLADWIEP